MGTKDITENYLEAYNDVFADIVNVLLFQGEKIIIPEQLTNAVSKAVYKADDGLHEEERDISKYWSVGNIRIAIYGIENQTDIHPYMPLRLMGYDGASYREQLLTGTPKEKYPVITLVLYFGTERPWGSPLALSDCFNIPKKLTPYFSDYRINVFNIAFLSDETIGQFTSDFRIVADYFSQMRKKMDYKPSSEQIVHVDAVLKMMSLMTGDDRFIEVQQMEKGEVHTMCEVMDRIERKGQVEGQKNTLFRLVEKGKLDVTDAAQDAGLSDEEFLSQMESAGYKIPALVSYF